MKKNIVAFLSIEDVKIGDLIETTKDCETFQLKEDVEDDFILLTDKTIGSASWAPFFSEFDLDPSLFQQKTVKGMLIIKVKNRHVIFTFGHGRSLLNLTAIERGFGLRVSMNIGDPAQIKSIDKATLDRVARNTRSQVSVNSGIEDFDFEFDHEILKSFTAVVENDNEDLELVSGNNSVSIYTELSFEKFKPLANRLLDAFNSIEYKKRYPWADFIGLENRPSIISELDDLLVQKFEDKYFGGIWIAPPKIMDYFDFSGFVYNTNPKKDCSICKHPELDLEAFISEVRINHPISIQALKSKKICIYNGSDQQIDAWRFYDTLNCEMQLHDLKYVLNDGSWYQIKDSFAQEVEQFFNNMKSYAGPKLDPYFDKSEADYLNRIKDGEYIALLDQKWIYPKDTGQRLEFCDLFTQCNRIIHVKRYGSSAVFSHLFSQATTGLELLLFDDTIISQVNDQLEDTYLSLIFDPIKTPRDHKIVLAIIHSKPGPVHMPFFSKVNLRHHVRNIESKGFDVELAKIDVDQLKLQKTLGSSN